MMDSYVICKDLGQSNMSKVYLVQDKESKEYMVVKEVGGTYSKEGEILKGLSHERIPRCLGYQRDGCKEYIFMEYIPGTSLQHFVNKKISNKRVRKWTLEIVDILTYIHGQNPPIYHLDIKPSNFIVGLDGKIHLLDFGTATIKGEVATGYGTKKYASVEQQRGEMPCEAMDWYSLGKTVEVLTKNQSLRTICRHLTDQKEKRWTGKEVRRYLRWMSVGRKALALILLLGLVGIIPEEKQADNNIVQEITTATSQTETTEVSVTKMEEAWMLTKTRIGASRDEKEIKGIYEEFLEEYTTCQEAYVDYGIYLCQRKQWSQAKAVYIQGEKHVKMDMEKAKQLKEKLGL